MSSFSLALLCVGGGLEYFPTSWMVLKAVYHVYEPVCRGTLEEGSQHHSLFSAEREETIWHS